MCYFRGSWYKHSRRPLPCWRIRSCPYWSSYGSIFFTLFLSNRLNKHSWSIIFKIVTPNWNINYSFMENCIAFSLKPSFLLWQCATQKNFVILYLYLLEIRILNWCNGKVPKQRGKNGKRVRFRIWCILPHYVLVSSFVLMLSRWQIVHI